MTTTRISKKKDQVLCIMIESEWKEAITEICKALDYEYVSPCIRAMLKLAIELLSKKAKKTV